MMNEFAVVLFVGIVMFAVLGVGWVIANMDMSRVIPGKHAAKITKRQQRNKLIEEIDLENRVRMYKEAQSLGIEPEMWDGCWEIVSVQGHGKDHYDLSVYMWCVLSVNQFQYARFEPILFVVPESGFANNEERRRMNDHDRRVKSKIEFEKAKLKLIAEQGCSPVLMEGWL